MIDIKIDKIKEELSRFNSAVNEFRPYTQGFIRNTAQQFKGFNSDFAAEMDRLLEHMMDSKAPKLLKKAENLHSVTKNIVDKMESLEKEIANKIGQRK